MKTWLYLCLLLLLTRHAGAQQPSAPASPGRVLTGKLLDAGSGAPVPYATINVLDAAAQLVTGGISDEAGGFRLEGIPPGPFTVEFRFLGYQTLSQPLPAGSGRLELGPIKLQPITTQLGEVTVTGEKPAVSLQLDKKVFEVGKDILSQGGSGHDVLNGVPSVAVSPGGGISLRGNTNVTVLINGRRSGLTQNSGLDQIPAAQIERVEVITNPSARYDAGGSAGIINVILKKNKQSGLGGQVRLVGGLPNDTRLTPSLTFKSSKVNLFATAGLRWSDYRGRYRTDQVTDLADGRPARLQQRQRENRHDDGKVLYVGADYFINDHNTLTAAFLKNDTKDHDKTELNYQYATGAGATDSTLQRRGESWESRSYNQLELNYTRLFAQAGRKYTVDVQYDFWNSDKEWQLATARLLPQTQDLPGIRTSSVGASKDLLVQTDLVQPLGAQTTLEMGLKAEGRQVSSDFGAEQARGAEWATFRGIDNQLHYNELISSGYAQYGRKGQKLSYLLGLRAELTRVRIQDREGQYSNEKRYNRLFPTLNLGYQLREGLTTQLTYSRRINRPTLWLLYPFNELTDLNAQNVGNPDLSPSYADGLELGLLRTWRSLTFNPAVYFQRTSGFIQTYTYRDAAGTFISTPVNLSRETRRGLELSVLYSPLKWLSVNSELNLYAFTQQGRYREQDFALSGHTLTGRLSTQLKLPLKLGVQARYNFTGAQRTAQTFTRALHVASVAVSKNLLRDKATLVLDGSNLFDSNQTRTRTTGPEYVFSQVSSPNAARYRLSFTYRFNLQDGQAIRQAKSSNRN
ncbi:outer membrane beta-barrel family protein [Hymenobacter chitinivorans]|uniref:Outer membrane receptor protein involved in Fe transport n=1 Tax=Hymenobacter chitinivorans DSM 11115 TaxID=1121954 RepID=A0A2M9BQD9_9BACT|nr:outer membrane beta-barrel family protein [Hymenobacter chitinivorans]PJJ60166.1 outer membrane receptor protein involved in Fe transport [Hymenobacter chitinivorans DSM 11115]